MAFVGWNGSLWEILDTNLGVTDWVGGNKKTFVISNTIPYLKYRVNVTANNGHASFLNIAEIEMMEVLSSYSPIIPASWQSISTTLPTLDTFKNEGIDDLSTLNRAETVIALPMDDNTASGTALGSGKVFKERIDLNKFFDLKKLNVK